MSITDCDFRRRPDYTHCIWQKRSTCMPFIINLLAERRSYSKRWERNINVAWNACLLRMLLLEIVFTVYLSLLLAQHAASPICSVWVYCLCCYYVSVRATMLASVCVRMSDSFYEVAMRPFTSGHLLWPYAFYGSSGCLGKEWLCVCTLSCYSLG